MPAMIPLLVMSAAMPTSPALRPYFPTDFSQRMVRCEKRFAPMAVMSASTQKWVSEHLRAANEPSLWARAAQGGGDAIRFTWLRSFHRPAIVRVAWRPNSRPRLLAYLLSGSEGGFAPGTVIRRLDRPLTAAETRGLAQALRRAGRFPPPQPCGDLSTDGAQWVVERLAGSVYALSSWHSPDEGSVRDIGLALVRLTGWNLGPIY